LVRCPKALAIKHVLDGELVMHRISAIAYRTGGHRRFAIFARPKAGSRARAASCQPLAARLRPTGDCPIAGPAPAPRSGPRQIEEPPIDNRLTALLSEMCGPVGEAGGACLQKPCPDSVGRARKYRWRNRRFRFGATGAYGTIVNQAHSPWLPRDAVRWAADLWRNL